MKPAFLSPCDGTKQNMQFIEIVWQNVSFVTSPNLGDQIYAYWGILASKIDLSSVKRSPESSKWRDHPFYLQFCRFSFVTLGLIVLSFQCGINGCDKAYTNKSNLKTHKRIVHGVDKFFCPAQNCELKFYNQSNLEHHSSQHPELKGSYT